MVQGKKCLAVHSALPPIVFVFLPERIGGEQEHVAEENVQQDKRDVHGNETGNHGEKTTQIHSSRGRRIRVPSDQQVRQTKQPGLTGCAAGHVDACWL